MNTRTRPEIWRQALGPLAEDFLHLFLTPLSPGGGTDYPLAPAMSALADSQPRFALAPPRHLLRLDQLLAESGAYADGGTVADWAVLFQWEILNACGDQPTLAPGGPSFEALMEIAALWGRFLARSLQRTLATVELYRAAGDVLFAPFRRLPAADLGRAVRLALTPGYLKAQAAALYAQALGLDDPSLLQEAAETLQTPDADLAHEIDLALGGASDLDLGTDIKRRVAEAALTWQELCRSDDFARQLRDSLPSAMQALASYIGSCFHHHLSSDTGRAGRVLKAVNRRGELAALPEQYRFRHGWEGDRDEALTRAWGAIAPRRFGLSGDPAAITEDEHEETLIGVAKGLEDYCGRNPAIVGLLDGASGGLAAYLTRAGKNRGTSWHREQQAPRNSVLTQAEHVDAEDFRSPQRSPDLPSSELSEDDMLSRLKEKFDPSPDVGDELAGREIISAWLSALTAREREAVELQLQLDTQDEIAAAMDLRQYQVSRLLAAALKKYLKMAR